MFIFHQHCHTHTNDYCRKCWVQKNHFEIRFFANFFWTPSFSLWNFNTLINFVRSFPTLGLINKTYCYPSWILFTKENWKLYREGREGDLTVNIQTGNICKMWTVFEFNSLKSVNRSFLNKLYTRALLTTLESCYQLRIRRFSRN